MLVYVTQASMSSDLESAYGKPYCATYWNSNSKLSLVSDHPFKRGDVMELESTNREDVFMLNKVSLETADKYELESMSVLLPISTDVPLSNEAEYSFEVAQGEVEILTEVRGMAAAGEFATYLLLTSVKSPKSKVVGTDKVYGDQFEWTIFLEDEFKDIRLMRERYGRLIAEREAESAGGATE